MTNNMTKYYIKNASGLRKKELFIDLLAVMVERIDQFTDTRLEILNILFGHYNDDGTPRTSQDDLLTFIMQNDEEDLEIDEEINTDTMVRVPPPPPNPFSSMFGQERTLTIFTSNRDSDTDFNDFSDDNIIE